MLRRRSSLRNMVAGGLPALRSPRALAVGTGVRIVASPVVIALLLDHDWTTGASLFLLAAATDFLDGRLARHWQVTTKLGGFLDTTADKLLVTAALIGLLAVHRASVWVAFVIIARELTILGLRAAVAAGGAHMETSASGRWKAALQFVAIATAILRPHVLIAGAHLDQWLLALAAVVTVYSGVAYLRAALSTLRS